MCCDSYLDEVGKAGENATEFLGLFQNLISDSQWKFYLASRGILPIIGQLITKVGTDYIAPKISIFICVSVNFLCILFTKISHLFL